MAARAGYTALTPETTVFPPRFIPTPVSEAIEPVYTTTTQPGYFASTSHAIRDTLLNYWDKLRDFVDNNAGLLLVALAQLFFAFVNVSVKVLKEIDVPMPTLEVCTASRTQPAKMLTANCTLCSARARPNGTCSRDDIEMWRAKWSAVNHLHLLSGVHVG